MAHEKGIGASKDNDLTNPVYEFSSEPLSDISETLKEDKSTIIQRSVERVCMVTVDGHHCGQKCFLVSKNVKPQSI